MATKKVADTMQFRVNTPQLLREIVDCALPRTAGVLKVPLNVFQALLVQVAKRAGELNDPIMNKCMFDLNLYELPSPATKAYDQLLRKVYKAAENQMKKELKKTKK